MLLKKKKGLLASIAPFYKAGATYQGPGDIVSGATAWGSSARAYSAAFAAGGTAVLDLVDQAGANPITINILTTGFVDVASINTWVTAHSVTTICVTKVYDQTGTGNHWTQATLANMPTLTRNIINGLPAMTFASSQTINTTTTFTVAANFSFSTVYERTSGTAIGGAFGGAGGSFIGAGTGANLAVINNSTSVTETATDNAWHGLNALVTSGAASALNVDGTDFTSLNAGSAGLSAVALRFGRAGTNELLGNVAEGGFWQTTALTPTQRGNLYTNMHGASGYNGAF